MLSYAAGSGVMRGRAQPIFARDMRGRAFSCPVTRMRKEAWMSQLENLNRAMGYVEEHLDGTLDLKELSRIAGCSQYQDRKSVV